MVNDDFARAKIHLEEAMKDDEDNYEVRFQEWKKSENDKKDY